MSDAICKYCFRPITEEVLQEKKRRKVQNAINSTKKRIANGTRAGRKSVVDWDKAYEMRQNYKKYSQIAAHFKVSRSAIWQGFKKRGWI